MKKIFALSTLSSALLLSTSIFAGGPVPSPAELETVQQLKALNTNVQVVGNRMQAIAEANAKSQHSTVPDANILQSMLANPAVAKHSGANDTNLTTATNTDIADQLKLLPENMVQTGSGLQNSDQIESDLQDNANTIANLTQNLTASDSIYSNDPTVLSLTPMAVMSNQLPKRGLTQPKSDELHDNYFNFNSLIQPSVYDTDQATAANTYLQFLTKSYQHPSDMIDANAFRQKLAEAKNGQDKLSLYIQLLNDKNYRKYQLEARSNEAVRSIAVNNFQKMITERTPIKNLGAQAGLKDNDGKTIADASPLQVQDYLANHRVSDPKWYAHVQAESSANVQRETLVVLAEIEAQNYQAHLDRERLLATISAQAAQTSELSEQSIAINAQNVNKDIANFTIPSEQQESNNQKKS